MSDATAPVSGETLAFGQTLKSSNFVGLGIKNGLLNIVTLGIYSFWAKTATRRKVWENVQLNGEAFAYTGKGLELFLGFLLGLVCLLVPYVAVIALGALVHKAFLILFLPLYFLFIGALGAAVFMAFRYVAGRTTWRGTRFQLKGSPAKFGASYLGYVFLVLVTLGWFAPAATMRLSGKLWGNLAFGDKALGWRRSDKEGLYGPFALSWLVGIVGYFGLIAMMMPTIMANAQTGGAPDVAFIGKLYAYALVYVLVVIVASAAYHAAVIRAVIASIRLDEVRFSIAVKAVDLIVLSLTNALILIFSLGFLIPVVEARSARFVISRLSSSGLVDLSQVKQAPRGSGSDEGLADAFGISTF